MSRYYDSSRTNMSVLSIPLRGDIVVVVAPCACLAAKKFEASFLSSGSLILTTVAKWWQQRRRGNLTWTRKFPLQRTGNIFQRPAKPLQIHAVYVISPRVAKVLSLCPSLVRKTQRNNAIRDTTV